MIRCANCGADRVADICGHCGLNSIEAGRSVRRDLVNRLGIFLVGAIAFFVPCVLYPPLELDGILIFIGIVFFATIGLAMWVEHLSIRHQEIELLKRVFRALVPIPWLLGALLFINGSLDHSPPEDHDVTIVSRFAMPGLLPMHQLIVTSWRDGRGVERIAVSRQDFDRFRERQQVEVRVEGGFVGIPWIFGVYDQ